MKSSLINNPPPPLSSGDIFTHWKEGAILHSLGCKVIEHGLVRWQRRLQKEAGLPYKRVKVFGTHDAICVYKCGVKGFGEMLASARRGVWTPVTEYQRKIVYGEAVCRYLWPIGATEEQGTLAAARWSKHEGKMYDFPAFFRLLVKAYALDLQDWPWPFSWLGKWQAGSRWMWYCTESVNDCWKDLVDVYGKTNPTPLTTEHRAGWNYSRSGRITLKTL